MWAERLALDLDAKRQTPLLDVVLEQLELRRRVDADPHHTGASQAREGSDPAQPHRYWPVSVRNLVHGCRQLCHQRVGLFAEELEREVQSVLGNPGGVWGTSTKWRRRFMKRAPQVRLQLHGEE
jgi:hypothetical protein